MKRITILLFFIFIFSLSFGQSWNWGAQGNVGKNGLAEGYSLTNDINKNAFLTGSFLDTMVIKSNIIISDSNLGAFIMKYDSSGNIKWAKCSQWGHGGNGCNSYSVVADKNGDSYITGVYEGTVIFYPDTLTDPVNTSIYFLTKYDKNGNVLWAKRANGSSASISWAVATSNDFHEYITGEFAGTLICGPNTLSTSGGAIFLAKYDSTGKVIWGRQSTGGSHSYAVITDSKSNVFITGYFSDSLTFGSIVLTTPPPYSFFSFF